MNYGPQSTEQELVAACLAGQRSGQEVFYRRFAPAALHLCRRYAHGPEEAQELLNSGMLRVFQKLGTFKWEGSLEGWVKRVVFRVVADHFRSKRQPATLELADWDQAAEAGITSRLYADDLCRIIDGLPGISKEVFWLFAVEGYSHAEIALTLSLTESNSRWHLYQARNVLKEKLASNALNSNKYAG